MQQSCNKAIYLASHIVGVHHHGTVELGYVIGQELYWKQSGVLRFPIRITILTLTVGQHQLNLSLADTAGKLHANGPGREAQSRHVAAVLAELEKPVSAET